MNSKTLATVLSLPPVSPQAAPSTAYATNRRIRDFGIGYGNSSGYVQRPRYAPDNGRSLFRVA